MLKLAEEITAYTQHTDGVPPIYYNEQRPASRCYQGCKRCISGLNFILGMVAFALSVET